MKAVSRFRIPSKARARLLATAIAALFASGETLALPVGPAVVNGTASIAQVGNALTINNSAGAILNWQKFSIGADELVRFNQPSAASSVLNRVLAADPSVIYGQLSSNGKVFLINPAGILVGAGAKIDTAGFVASTLGISNSDFLAGKLNFKADGSAGSVINQGEITTPLGGNVYLIGSQVTNQGLITTPQGETILAAGATVSLIDTATPGVKVDITGAEGNVTNLGQITADAGRIGMAGVLVRNSGQLNASSVVNQGGRIFLKASQDTYVDQGGRMLTTGSTGGSVEILGNRVAITDQAQVDASGEQGGGQILVGGDYQGKNPNIQNAQVSYVGKDTQLKASATLTGAGGKVIVWSDDTTRAYGTIEAKGGLNGGDGGFIETSGKRYLDVAGIKVDTRAADGSAGWWLLDPTDITITHYGEAVNPGLTVSGNTSTIADYDINQALLANNIVISTSPGGTAPGTITINGTGDAGGAADINHGGAVTRSLTFSADSGFNAHYGSVIRGAVNAPLNVTISAAGSAVVAGGIYSYGGDIVLAGQGVTLGNGIVSGGLNARADGLGPGGSITTADIGAGGRIRVSAGTGTLTINASAGMHTSNTSTVLLADGTLDPYGGPAIGIVAGDIAIDATAAIRTSYYYGGAGYGGGDISILPSTADGVRLGNGSAPYGGMTIDNTELPRIITAGTNTCATGNAGCRLWIGTTRVGGTDVVTGAAIPTTTADFVLDTANFAINNPRNRAQINTTGHVNDAGGLGAISSHLAVAGSAGVGNADADGLTFYGQSLLLGSANGDIVASSWGNGDLALRGATAPLGSVTVYGSGAFGDLVLLPFFDQAISAQDSVQLVNLTGGIRMAAAGVSNTVYGSLGTFSETPGYSASISTTAPGATISLEALGNISAQYGAGIRGSLGGPADVLIGSQSGAITLHGGVRSYGGNIVLSGTGIEIGNPAAVDGNSATGLNARADGIGPGGSVTTADIAEGGRIRVNAGTGTLTINPYGGMHTSNTGHLLQADGTIDSAGTHGGVAIGINAGDIEFGYGGGIRATYASGGAGYGGGDIVILTDAAQIRLGDYATYGGTLTLDNAELSRIILNSTGNCATGNLGCRLWIGLTGSIFDPVLGGNTAATSAAIVANGADFTLNGATPVPKRVHLSTTSTINDAGTGGTYYGAKSLLLSLSANGGIGTGDPTDGFNFAGDILAVQSADSSAALTHVSPGTLVLRGIDAPSGGASLHSTYGGIALIPLFPGQGIDATGSVLLSAYGDIVFAYGGQVFPAVGGGSGFGTFSQTATGQAGLIVGGDFGASAGGDIRFGGGTIPYYQVGNNLSLTGTNIEIVDTKILATATATLDASQGIVIRGNTTSAWVGNFGDMNVSAGNLSIYGGNLADPNSDFFAFSGDVHGGLFSIGDQTIDVSGGTILLQAGNANTGLGGGIAKIFGSGAVQTIKAQSIAMNGGGGQSDYASIYSSGNQILTIYGGQLVLTAGSGVTGNLAELVAHGNQTLQFYGGGSIALNGGTSGVDNYAEIGSEIGNQWIGSVYGANPTIVLTGGASGGSFDHNNDAGIHLDDNTNISGTQTVYAASISIYGGNAAYGGAGFGLEQSGIGHFFVDGNVFMQGGASSAGDPTAAAAYIGADAYGANITLDIGGNLTMIGGTGTSAPAIIGSLNDTLLLTADIGGALTMTAGGSAARIGSNAGAGLGGAQISISATGAVTLTSSATQSASIGTFNSGALVSVINVHGATVSLDGTAGGKVGIGVRDVGGADQVNITATAGNLTVTGYGGIGVPTAIGSSVHLDAYGAGAMVSVDGDAANGVSIGADSLSVYGQGGISIRDATVTAGTLMTVTTPGALSISAVDRGTDVTVGGAAGGQTITAGSLTATGGGTVAATGYGAYVNIAASSGSQTITVSGAMSLQGGSYNGAYGGGSSVSLVAQNQIIQAGSLSLNAGGVGHSNPVFIAANGAQTIGANSITLSGGGATGSYDNFAGIFQNSATGSQTIDVNGGGTLAMYGGSGTGTGSANYTWDCGFPGTNNCAGMISWNNARIRNAGSGAQSITFAAGGNLWLQGGAGGTFNRAMIEANGGGAQNILGGAAITLIGGASGGTSFVYGGSTIYLDNGAFLFNNNSTYTLGNQTIVASSLTLDGGATGGVGGAYVSGANQNVSVSGNATVTGGSGAGIHSRASVYSFNSAGTQSVTIGGNLTLDAGDNASGGDNMATLYAYGGSQTVTVGGMLAAYGGAAGHDNKAFVGFDTAGTGDQHVTAGNVYLRGGGAAGSYNNSAQIYNSSTHNQLLTLQGTGAQLTLVAGSGTGTAGSLPDTCVATPTLCADLAASNYASISSRGTDQTVAFVYGGGGISMTGGSAGLNNQALIYNAGTGVQTITGDPNISMTAGTGGVYIRDLDYLLGNHARIVSSGTQDVFAHQVTLAGGAGAAAAITAVDNFYLVATGDVSLTGGSAGALNSFYGGVADASPTFVIHASAAELGSRATSSRIVDFDIDGNLSLTGGSGASGLAFMGNLGGPVDMVASVLGSVSIVSNGGLALIGSLTDATNVANANLIHLTTGALSLNAGSGTTYGAGIGSRYDAVDLVVDAASVQLTANGTGDAAIGTSYGGASTVTVTANGNIALATGAGGGTARIGIGSGVGSVMLQSDTGLISTSAGSIIYGGDVTVHTLDGDIALLGVTRAAIGALSVDAAFASLVPHTANLGAASAGAYGGVMVHASGDVLWTGLVNSDTGTVSVDAAGNIYGGAMSALGIVNVMAARNIVMTGNVTSLAGGANLHAGIAAIYGGNLGLGSGTVDAYGGINLNAMAGAAAAGDISWTGLLTSAGTPSLVWVTAAGNVTGSTINAASGASVMAGRNLTMTGNVTSSAGSATLTAGSGAIYGGNLSLGSGTVDAYGGINLNAMVGSAAAGDIDWSGLLSTSGASFGVTAMAAGNLYGGAISANGMTNLSAGRNLAMTGNVTSITGMVDMHAGMTVYGGNLSLGSATVTGYGGVHLNTMSGSASAGDITWSGLLTSSDAASSINVNAAFGNVTGGTITSPGLVEVMAGRNLTMTGNVSSTGGTANLHAGGATYGGNLSLGSTTVTGYGGVNLIAMVGSEAAGDISWTGLLTSSGAASSINVNAIFGNVTGGAITTQGAAQVSAGRNLTMTGNLTSAAGSATLHAGSGGMYGGNLSLGSTTVSAYGGASLDAMVGSAAAGDIGWTGAVTSTTGSVFANAAGNLSSGTTTGPMGVMLNAFHNVAVNGATTSVAGNIDISAGLAATYGGNITIGAVPVSANGPMNLTAVAMPAGTGAISWAGPLSSTSGSVTAIAGENVGANGNVTAATNIYLFAGAGGFESANGYGGNFTSSKVFTSGSDMKIQAFGGSRFAGNVTTSSGFSANAGTLSIFGQGEVSLVGNIGSGSTTSNVLKAGYDGTAFVGQHNLNISSTTAYGAAIVAEASGAVSGTFYGASALTLESVHGGTASGKAIVAEVRGPVATSITGIVDSGATYGGIQIVSSGMAPSAVALNDYATNNSTASFTQYGNLVVGTGAGRTSISQSAHDLAVQSTGDMTVYSDLSLSPTSVYGSVLIGTTGNLTFDGASADLFIDGDVAATAGGNVTFQNGAYLHGENLAVISGGATSVQYGAEIGAWHDVGIASFGDIRFWDGRMHSDYSDVYFETLGDIRLNADSHVYAYAATASAFLTLRGVNSKLYVNDTSGMPTSTIDVGSPDTIHIDFTAGTATDRIIIDGAPSTTTSPGGSGFYVNGVPAEPGAGLEIAGGILQETPPIVSDVINTVNQAADSSPTESPTGGELALLTPSGTTDSGLPGGTTQTTGGGEGSFGGDAGNGSTEGSQASGQGEDQKDDKKDDKKDAKGEDGKDGKKDDGKGAGKKVAQCS